MSNPPSRDMVLTRGARKRMLQSQSAREEPYGDVDYRGPRQQSQVCRGSIKPERKTHSKSSKMSRNVEFEAQKKLIELQAAEAAEALAKAQHEAAEALAKAQQEVIKRKMAAKIAALEEQYSHRSASSECSSSSLPNRVEDWLKNSEQNVDIIANNNCVNRNNNFHQSVDAILYTARAEPIEVARSPINDANTQFSKLAEVLKEVAVAATTNSANAGMVSRLCTPKELPTYYGDPMEWLAFKQAYEESTEVCQFTAKENMWRLRKCLRGAARESVTALLISAADPEAVMSTLELQFGQPDVILPRILNEIRKLHPVGPEYHRDIVSFSIKVKNYVTAVRL